EAAKRKMVIDFHGAYKPAGLRRAYPNVLTREGVIGLEHNKWEGRRTNPNMAVILPFTRMVAGPMDYTPGAMLNANRDTYAPFWNRPMSLGTRCQQMAMYVVYESPLQMLADSPSNYYREPECTEFIAGIPTVWDQTIVLDAEVESHVLVARKSGDQWYIGGLTGWDGKDLQFELSFIEKGEHQITIMMDGINADRYAGDYKKVTRNVRQGDTVELSMSDGGGWVAIISPIY
ncbi:MAG: glycoside hydrolase family 97 catalytic domain-containing protein, partial [Pirellulales bacterium]|nr:glycoside hydrolase family 97 catalytic domain-containing protein [Pirellulales bacterium]